MAVSLVALLVTAMVAVNFALAALTFALLRGSTGLSPAELLRAPFMDVALSAEPGARVVQPFDVVYAVAVAIGEIALLVGFLRLRRWAWVGLMSLACILLAAALARYVAFGSHLTRDFVTMATQSVIVLSLNAQVVQEAFGLLRPPPEGVPISAVQRTGAAPPR
jgi:hypothetical protein